jgi:hypothetical protein
MHPCNYELGWDPCNYKRGWASMGSGKLRVTIYADITRHFSLRRRYRQWVRAGPRKELYFNPTEVCSRPPTVREQVWLQPPLITVQVRLRRSVPVRLGRKCPTTGWGRAGRCCNCHLRWPVSGAQQRLPPPQPPMHSSRLHGSMRTSFDHRASPSRLSQLSLTACIRATSEPPALFGASVTFAK